MTQEPSWRIPTSRLVVNGQAVAGIIETEIETNAYFSSDKFAAKLALRCPNALGMEFWASVFDIQIEALLSLDGINFTSLITGVVDTVRVDPVQQIVDISGRDLSARLIEARTQGIFPNHTASEIAVLLAERHNLVPNVTPTSNMIGRYYQSEHDKVSLDYLSHLTTDWDLLAYLADQEGYGLSVAGTTLSFGPQIQQSLPPYIVAPSDAIQLRLERRLTLARDVDVTVKSWNSYQKSAFSQTVRATSQATSGTGNALAAQQFVYVHPNLTPDQAVRFAQQKLASLTIHERLVEMHLPGDLILAPNMMLAITDTGTDFDQLYYVEAVIRRIDSRNGFTQRVRAKNASPRTSSPMNT